MIRAGKGTPRRPLKAEIVALADLFEARFVPAAVQRGYQWDRLQVGELLADLERAFAEDVEAAGQGAAEDFIDDETPEPAPEWADGDWEDAPEAALDAGEGDETAGAGGLGGYYLGEVVLTEPDGEGVTGVFDGMQRLTTLTILLSHLRDRGEDAALSAALGEMVMTPEGAPRLRLDGADPTLIKEIQTPGESVRRRQGVGRTPLAHRLRSALRALREPLKTWPPERLDAFARYIRDEVYVTRVCADAGPQGAAFARRIFITKNMRGKPLRRVDLFKGELLDIAEEAGCAEQAAAAWVEVEALLGDELEPFLVAVDAIERRRRQGADCLAALAERLRVGGSKGGALGWLDRLQRLAAAWRDLDQRLHRPPVDALDADIWRLRFFEWREWRPLALYWLADFREKARRGGANAKRARGVFAKRMDALHRRVMAMELRAFPGATREDVFLRALTQAQKGENPFAKALAFTERSCAKIQANLRAPLTDDARRRPLLRWLESAQWRPAPPPHVASATVEHILPRNPEPGSSWLKRFDCAEDRYSACRALGNLALLDYADNERAGNAEFAAKKTLYGEQASRYRLLDDVVSASDWGAAEIAARTERLAAAAWKELDLPPPLKAGSGRAKRSRGRRG